MRPTTLAAVTLVLLVFAGIPIWAQDNKPKEKAGAEAIVTKLDAAKAEYAKSLEGVRKKLGMAVEGRLKAAQDSGDLKAVETLTAVKKALEAEGKLPDGVTDTPIKLAKATADRDTVTARGAMIAAYEAAIKEMTKAGLFDEAKVIQTELEEFKSGVTKDPNVTDLLKLIDPQKTVKGAAWVKKGQTLIIPGLSALSIPYVPPAEYDLTLSMRRVRGNDTFTIGLIAGDTRCEVQLDGWGHNISGIDHVDGKSSEKNATSYPGLIFTNGKMHTIVCSVRKDSITVSRDGRKVINFTGEMNRITDGFGYKSGDFPTDRLWLGASKDPFVIGKIELKAISGQGKVIRP